MRKYGLGEMFGYDVYFMVFSEWERTKYLVKAIFLYFFK
jgi:hypothetical protein